MSSSEKPNGTPEEHDESDLDTLAFITGAIEGLGPFGGTFTVERDGQTIRVTGPDKPDDEPQEPTQP